MTNLANPGNPPDPEQLQQRVDELAAELETTVDRLEQARSGRPAGLNLRLIVGAVGTWTAPDGEVTTVRHLPGGGYDLTGHWYTAATIRGAERLERRPFPDEGALAAYLAQLEQWGHLPTDNGDDAREIRIRLDLDRRRNDPPPAVAGPEPCPDWCTTDHAKHDRFERYVDPVMDLRTHSVDVAAIDNPGAGAGPNSKVDVSVYITDDLGEQVRGEVLIDVHGAECMRPDTATAVAAAIGEAVRIATGSGS